MVMQFRTVKAAIASTLSTAAAARFRVIGHQSQSQNAETTKGNLRSVRVYYASGNFDKRAGAPRGGTQHDLTFNIELTATQPGKVDLTVLENPASTEAQKAAALTAAKEADQLADESFDELADIVYQILMDAKNYDFGLTNQVANRWVNSIQKDTISRLGGLITITGVIQLTLRVAETITGDTTGVPLEGIDSAFKIEDQPAVTGVSLTYP